VSPFRGSSWTPEGVHYKPRRKAPHFYSEVSENVVLIYEDKKQKEDKLFFSVEDGKWMD